MTARGLTRRGALALGGAGLAATVLPPCAVALQGVRSHGMTVIGDLKYPRDFKHFDYVNPDAPRGGRIVTQSPSALYNQNFETFNTLNIYVLRGDGAFGMQLTFASLMAASSDESGSVYGYVAREVETDESRKALRFFLRPEARFHDGTPIRAADVAFSLDILKEKGHPLIASQLRNIAGIAVEDDSTILVTIAESAGRSVPLIVATAPIFSAAWWADREFDASLSTAPLGSGPYRLNRYVFGNYAEFQRVEDDWAAGLPVMVGRYNFDILRYDYYRDRTASFEAFKKGTTTFREEFTSRIWARDYDFPALRDGRIVRDEIPDGSPSGGQGWYFNTRRRKFADPRIRRAIGNLFDFEWVNRNVMFGSFERTASFFENSVLKAEGLPGEAELALLEPYRDRLDPAVFEEPFVPPVSDGSGRDRNLRQAALDLFLEAGCRLDGNTLIGPDGEPFTIEFLMDHGSAGTFEPHHNAFIGALSRVGIRATYRPVDPAQYNERMKTFDFDMAVGRFVMGLYPSESIYLFFGSASADEPGSRNLGGIADPVIDSLLDRIVHADDWDGFVAASRAVDRILRASHYWVPQWHKASHWIAYWDIYGRPATKPPYDRAVLDTWWYDRDKAAAIGMNG